MRDVPVCLKRIVQNIFDFGARVQRALCPLLDCLQGSIERHVGLERRPGS